MNVVVTLEACFEQTPDGAVWTQHPFVYQWWTRYLDVFDNVRVVARVRRTAALQGEWRQASGANVLFTPVPFYQGPAQYLLHRRQVQCAVRGAVRDTDAVVMRVGSQLAACLEPVLCRRGHPFGLEVVGDPYDVFAPGAVHHPLRPFFRWWFSRSLRRQCQLASAVAYVTAYTLQQRYPCGSCSQTVSDVEITYESLVGAAKTFTTYYSSIDLPREFCSDRPLTPKPADPRSNKYNLIFVGSLEQLYKGPDVLLAAVARCLAGGLNLRLAMVGGGKYRAVLEGEVRRLGLDGRVDFLGQLPSGAAVRRELDKADLFVLPSRTEGLPRAVIEAMARGLPCIGSAVGGIPELLDPEDLVRPDDVPALAGKIREVLTSSERMSRMSARNLAKALEFREDLLKVRRRAFLQSVREVTEAWQRGRTAG